MSCLAISKKSKKQMLRPLFSRLCIPISLKRKSQPKAESALSGSFNEVAQMWLESNRSHHKGSTDAKYEYLLKTHIIPALGSMQIGDLSCSEINEFLMSKSTSGRLDGTGGLAPSYVRSIMLVIQAVLKYAQENAICEPFSGSLYRPNAKGVPVEVLSLEEQKRFESHLYEHCTTSKLGCFLALQTGLRIGEICALSWNDVDIDRGLLHVCHTITRSSTHGDPNTPSLCLDKPKTSSSLRTIPTSERLGAVLKHAYRTRTSNFVISEHEGFISPRTFDYRYHRMLEACSLPSRNFHTLRHTFATRCIEAGMDVKTLSEILGHANTSITLNTYVHSSLERKRKMLDQMSQYLT